MQTSRCVTCNVIILETMSVKVMSRDNLSLQLAMQFLPKKILQVAVRMSDVRNLFCDLQ